MSSVANNPAKPKRPAFVQFVEFLLLQKFRESGIESVLVGSVAAFAYGGDSPPRDLDVVIEWGRQTWQRILTLADNVDPQPGGAGRLQRDPISFPTQMHVGFGRGLDVLSGFQHASFAALYTRSEVGCVKVEGMDDLELPVCIAALRDLVEAWKARGQPRDLELIRKIGKR